MINMISNAQQNCVLIALSLFKTKFKVVLNHRPFLKI